VKVRFTPEELTNLRLAIVAINGWNRLSITFRVLPGSCKSPLQPLKERD
jgi:hypothetical protein